MPLPKPLFVAACLSAVLLAAAGCQSQDKKVTAQKPETDAPQTIQVQSPAFANGQPIPRRYATEENVSPPLNWTNIPNDTRTVAVVVEDPDAEGFKPYVHWVIYNIPPSVKSIPENRPHTAKLREPFEADQGKNSNREIGYFRPDPPKGDKPHHYYFQVYALDRVIEPKPDADPLTRDDIFKLIDGHVLAKGELVATFQRPKD